MADQPEVSENEEHARELRGKLIARLAVAGVLVALLLGVLAFFDYLANPPDEADQQVFTQPVPVAPKKEVSQPVTPAENLPEPPVPEKVEAPAEAPPPPTVDAPASAVVEAKPEAHVAAKLPAANVKPAVSVPPPPAPQAVPEATTAPSNRLAPQRAATPAEAAPAKPSVRIIEAKPAPAPAPAPAVVPPSAPRLFSGFLLQAGVFSSTQRAEELHARLTLSGVPSTLETRVQVGPFRTRHEAELAQAKLKELGVEAILVPPRGKN
uniref:Sporulation related protein n=1 Tax=Dechloromonas aromatica (strain RCB) TaxID=159087 RepID=Q47J70_DECAR